MKAGAIILSGGKSSRMGTNKALLKIDGKTNIERIKEALEEVFSDIILVTNEMEEYRFLNLPMVADIYPGKGPLAGIHSGLIASSYDVNFVVACDMPFISSNLAKYLIEQSDGYDVVVPKIGGKLHPLFSVFKKSNLSIIEDELKKEKLRIRDLFDLLKVRVINEDEIVDTIDEDIERSFYNMNSPSDYEAVKKWTKK